MSLTNPTHAVTAERLQEFYGEIYPYLNGPVIELEKPFKVWDSVSNSSISKSYTVESTGTYFVYVQPSRQGGSTGSSWSSISCSGDELYSATMTKDYCTGKLGIYRCESEDVIEASCGSGTGSGSYYICIININDIKFTAVDLDIGDTVNAVSVLSKTSSTPGKKFIFTFAYRNSYTDATYASINGSNVSYIEENSYATYGDYSRYAVLDIANCILYKGDSVTASATNRRADNNDGWGASSVYIFSLT